MRAPIAVATTGASLALLLLLLAAAAPAPASATTVAAVQAAAYAQGLADSIVPDGAAHLSKVLTVQSYSPKTQADVCGGPRSFPAVDAFTWDPTAVLTWRAEQTRGHTNVTFDCEAGKKYAIVIFDSGDHEPLNAAAPPAAPYGKGYAHWVRVNIECDESGPLLATTHSHVGEDYETEDGSEGIHFFQPGGGSVPHHYGVFLFEQTVDIKPTKPDVTTVVSNNTAFAFDINAFILKYALGSPIGRSWVRVEVDYATAVAAKAAGLTFLYDYTCAAVARVDPYKVTLAAGNQSLANSIIPNGASALRQWVKATYSARGDTVHVCDADHTLPTTVGFQPDPTEAVVLTSDSYRENGTIAFSCDGHPGAHGPNLYTVVAFDAGAIGHTKGTGIAHWLRINIPCTRSGRAEVSNVGDGGGGENYNVAGEEGFHYLQFGGFDVPHTYTIWVFQQSDTIVPSVVNYDKYTVAQREGEFDINEFIKDNSLGVPVGMTWANVDLGYGTPYWAASHHASDWVPLMCAALAAMDPVAVAAEAKGQGLADFFPGSADNLKFGLKVWFDAPAVDIQACGKSHHLAAVDAMAADPADTKVYPTTMTRVEPAGLFTCDSTPRSDGSQKLYTLSVFDPVATGTLGPVGYGHFAKYNIPCEAANGRGRLADGEVFESLPWFTPAAFGAAEHPYSWYIFEQPNNGAPIAPTPAQIAHVADENGRFGFNITEFADSLQLGLPVARTWMRLNNSVWSAHILESVGPKLTPYVEQSCAELGTPYTPPSPDSVSAVQQAAYEQGVANTIVPEGVSHLTKLLTVTSYSPILERELCQVTRRFPAVDAFSWDPTSALTWGAQQTRGRTNVTFNCEAGKKYALVLFDSGDHEPLGAAPAPAAAFGKGYAHWARINIECATSGPLTAFQDSRAGMAPGSDYQTSDASAGIRWFQPGGGMVPHHYDFFLFEQPGTITPSTSDVEMFVGENTNFQFDINAFIKHYGLGHPIGRSWVRLDLDYATAALAKILGLQALYDQVCDLLAKVDPYKVRIAATNQGVAESIVPNGALSLTQWVKATYSALGDTVHVCDADHELPTSIGYQPDPTRAYVLNSDSYRENGTIAFSCDGHPGPDGPLLYTVVAFDAGSMGHTKGTGIAHWLRINIPCTGSGRAEVSNVGDGGGGENYNVAGEEGFHYLQFGGFDVPHTYTIWVFQQGAGRITPSKANYDKYTVMQREAAFDINEFITDNELGAPMARTWANVDLGYGTPYWAASHHASDWVPLMCAALAAMDPVAVAAEAKGQGLADFFPGSADNLKYGLKVWFDAPAVDIQACGKSHHLAAVDAMAADPADTKVYPTTMTRVEPAGLFTCDATPRSDGSQKMHTLVLFDPVATGTLGKKGYGHFAKYNIPCEAANGRGSLADGDVFPSLPFFTPAAFGAAEHPYSWFIFEQPDNGAMLTPTNDQIQKFGTENGQFAFDITDFQGTFHLGDPVARTWMRLNNSFWSAHKLETVGPAVAAYVSASCAELGEPYTPPSGSASGSGSGHGSGSGSGSGSGHGSSSGSGSGHHDHSNSGSGSGSGDGHHSMPTKDHPHDTAIYVAIVAGGIMVLLALAAYRQHRAQLRKQPAIGIDASHTVSLMSDGRYSEP